MHAQNVDFRFGALEPRMFSFNSPFGACPTCDGLGSKLEVDLDLVIPDRTKTLREHAIAAWEPTSSQYYPQLLKAVCEHYEIDMDVPVKELPERQLDKILYGSRQGEKIYFHYENEFGQVQRKYIQFEGVISQCSNDVIRRRVRIMFVNRWKSTWRKSIAQRVKAIA